MLGVGHLECVSYGVVYGVSNWVDSDKAMISEGDCQERELRVKLCILIVETQLGRVWNVFFPSIYARCFNWFMCFVRLFLERLI